MDNRDVGSRSLAFVADVSSANSAAIEPVLRRLIDGEIIPTVNGFHVAATLSGESAWDLNRSLLSHLRRGEPSARLRSAWTLGCVTEPFFDYVPKGSRPAYAQDDLWLPPVDRIATMRGSCL